MNNECVFFSFIKLRFSLDVYLFTDNTFKIGIINVGGPAVKFIEFSKKEDSTDSFKKHNFRVCTLEGYLSEVPAGNKACLVSSVMLDIECKVTSNLLVAFEDDSVSFKFEIDEYIVFVDLR